MFVVERRENTANGGFADLTTLCFRHTYSVHNRSEIFELLDLDSDHEVLSAHLDVMTQAIISRDPKSHSLIIDGMSELLHLGLENRSSQRYTSSTSSSDFSLRLDLPEVRHAIFDTFDNCALAHILSSAMSLTEDLRGMNKLWYLHPNHRRWSRLQLSNRE